MVPRAGVCGVRGLLPSRQGIGVSQYSMGRRAWEPTACLSREDRDLATALGASYNISATVPQGLNGV